MNCSVIRGNNDSSKFEDLSGLETLPKEVLGNIIAQLPKVTGSVGILNEDDIPVTFRYLQNFACTCKNIYSMVNDPYITKLFLYALSRKYKIAPEEIASKLNILASRIFLWNYIKENRFDLIYSVIQDIHSLASNVLHEAKEEELHFDYVEGCKGWPSPNPFYYQTKEGLLLFCDNYPIHLATPFGKIKINGSCKIRNIEHIELKELNEHELEGKKELQNAIIYQGFSIYKIHKVKGKILSEPKSHDSQNFERSYTLINVIWEMLERKRQGKDPILKEIIPSEKKRKIISHEPPFFNNICEVAPWGVDIIKKLSQQPVLPGETFFDLPIKVLVLENYGKARILKILNDSASKYLEKNSRLYISTFGCGDNKLRLNGHDIGKGLILHLPEDLKNSHCDLVNLSTIYEEVMMQVGKNWELSSLRDYPEILHTKSEEDYVLYIKKGNTISNDDTFIRFLAKEFGISKYISCHDYWRGKGPIGSTYLWIRKDMLEKVKRILQLTTFSP